VSAPYVALDLAIPSDIHQIEHVVARVAETCRALRLTGRQCSFNVPVALSEALSNAILRGNHEDTAKTVRLRATVSDADVVFDVIDEGPGFDLVADLHDPTTPDRLTREDGRGLFLMRKLMDGVEQFVDRGNVVRLTLKRPPAP